ncbi:hypothetical protein [Flavobacterium sp. W22_SRS_FP1]|uniref:hypothetical protein n=1 Tax=Flavobacterium sp. W22_SRS_FP1 TaxID=3240276 RepID=UPI003F915434
MILCFFLFSGSSAMNDFYISDLFEVKQGKQLLDKVKLNNASKLEDINLYTSKIKVLTMNAVNFDTKSIDASYLLDYNSSSSIGSNSILNSNSYLINRVGKNRTISLLDIEDFDFNKNEIIAGNDFIFLQPRKIVLDNLPLFHALLDIALKDLIDEKAVNMTSKVQYITVKEIANKKISIPSEGFDEINKRFLELYEPYKKLFKSFNASKKRLNEFKNEFLKNKF